MSTSGTSPTLELKVRAPQALTSLEALAKAARELKTELAGLGSGTSTAGVQRLEAEVLELKAALKTVSTELEKIQATQAAVSRANINAAEQEGRARVRAAKTAAELEKATADEKAAYLFKVQLESAKMTGALAIKQQADSDRLVNAAHAEALREKEAMERASAARRLAAARVAAAAEAAAVRSAAGASSAAGRSDAGVGRSVARGLAGASGSLFLTYGQSIPALIGGYAAASAVKNTVQTGSEFQYQTAFSGALGGYNPEELARVRAELLKMGTDSVYGPLELAKGLRVLEQAGVGATDALKILPVAAKAALQGETDLASTSETLVGVMRQFGLGVNDIQKIGDAISMTASKTQATVGSLMESLKAAQGVSRYGVDLNTELSLIGILAKQGITGSSAGTFSRRMIEDLYTPRSIEAQRIMQRELGFSAYNKDGSRRDAREVISDFVGKVQPYDAQSQDRVLAGVLDIRGLKSASALITDMANEFGRLRGELDNSAGALDAFAKTMSGEVKNLWEQVKSNFQGALIDSFHDMEGPLKSLLSEMKDFFKDDSVRSFLKLLMSVPTGYGQILGFFSNPNFSGGLAPTKQQRLEQLNQNIDYNLLVNGFDPSKRGLSGGAILEEQQTIKNNAFLQQLVAQRDAITRGMAMDRAQQLAAEYAPGMAAESARLSARAPLGGAAGSTGSKRASLRTLDPLTAREQLQLSGARDAEATAAFRREAQRVEQEANDEQRLLDARHRYGLISENDYNDKIEGLNNDRRLSAVALANQEIDDLKSQQRAKWTEAQRLQNQTKQSDIAAKRDALVRESEFSETARKIRLEGEEKAARDITSKLLKENEAKQRIYVEQRNLAAQVRLMSPEDAAAALAGFDARKQYEVQLADQQAALEKTPEGRVKDVIRERISLLKEQRDAAVKFYGEEARAKVQLERSYGYGTQQAFREYVDAATNSAQQARDAWTGAFQSLETSLTQFIVKGKVDWSQFGDFIVQTLVRIQVQRAMAGVAQLFTTSGGVNTTSGDYGTLPAALGDGYYSPIGHTGGIVGALSAGRLVSPFVFAGAPRFHAGGVVGDEMPIIARRGEGVFTEEQMRSLAPAARGSMNVRVEMHNEGTPQQVTQVQPYFDAEGMVLRVITRDIERGGPVSRTLQTNFGMQRAPAA